jgi:putative SOS response-associated peptidase YedK
MCGRTLIHSDIASAAAHTGAKGAMPNMDVAMDQAPTDDLLVLVFDQQSRERRLRKMKFGLIPANDPKEGARYINAKSETVDQLRTFKPAWTAGRRGLVMTNGFYEWARDARGKTGQRYAIRRKSLVRSKEQFTTLACLWNVANINGGELYSCTILTTEPNELVSPIHNRMPVIIGEKDWPQWLGEQPATFDELKAMLRPYPASDMEAIPVKRIMPKTGGGIGDLEPFRENLL